MELIGSLERCFSKETIFPIASERLLVPLWRRGTFSGMGLISDGHRRHCRGTKSALVDVLSRMDPLRQSRGGLNATMV
jgi:hypothetical protein